MLKKKDKDVTLPMSDKSWENLGNSPRGRNMSHSDVSALRNEGQVSADVMDIRSR